jgi:hypothetical protein
MNRKIGKLKVNGSRPKELLLPGSYSSRKGLRTSLAYRPLSDTDDNFVAQVKILLAKINGEFVYFKREESKICRLVIRVPNDKDSANSRTFTGKMVEIKRDFYSFLKQYD